MTDEDVARETLAFRAGYTDKTQRLGHTGLQLLMLVDLTDGELSDYWYGWHQGARTCRSNRARAAKR